MFFVFLYFCFVDCCRFYLCDYEVYINIGVFEYEKCGEQCVVINVDLFVLFVLFILVDDWLYEVVDYDLMKQSVV